MKPADPQSYQKARNHKFAQQKCPNCVLSRQNDVFYFYDKMSWFVMIYQDISWYIMIYHEKMGILPLKKRVNRNKCNFATKQRMFGVFAIDEILRYRWSPFTASRTFCHPAEKVISGHFIVVVYVTKYTNTDDGWFMWNQKDLKPNVVITKGAL